VGAEAGLARGAEASGASRLDGRAAEGDVAARPDRPSASGCDVLTADEADVESVRVRLSARRHRRCTRAIVIAGLIQVAARTGSMATALAVGRPNGDPAGDYLSSRPTALVITRCRLVLFVSRSESPHFVRPRSPIRG
jgi:hypothetical protein